MREIEHPAIQKAHQHLHALSADDKAWLQAVQRERALLLESALKFEAEQALATAEAKGEARGEARGEAKGQAALLYRLLNAKFGPLPAPVEQHVQAATPAQLERWAEQLLFADTLDQVFSQH